MGAWGGLRGFWCEVWRTGKIRGFVKDICVPDSFVVGFLGSGTGVQYSAGVASVGPAPSNVRMQEFLGWDSSGEW